MGTEPTKFTDPTTYPVVFIPPEKETNLLKVKEFSVSFMYDENPRKAEMLLFAVKQLDNVLTNEDIYIDSNMALFGKNKSHTIELSANKKDITLTNFALKFYTSTNTFLTIEPGQVQSINQPAGTNNAIISHLFSMDTSTYIFDPINEGGTDYYPTATLELKFYPYIDTNFVWVDITLPDMTSTYVEMIPPDCRGILDVWCKVHLNWYSDENRTIPSPSPSWAIDDNLFGMRFYVSNIGGIFKKGVLVTNGDAAIATGLYSTTTLTTLESGSHHEVYYWGKGELKSDLFLGHVDPIIILDNGLPLQGFVPVAVYILNNPLPDIYSSSSSSKSSSSTQSLSSSSLNSSISSISSISSLSSSSSSSSSSFSTSSKSSSSTSSLSSSSSSSSSSTAEKSTSSTELGISSSSSSTSTNIFVYSSSSSSIEEKVLLRYLFNENYNTFYEVLDNSGNSRTAKVNYRNPPSWSTNEFIYGGKYAFYSSSYSSKYIFTQDIDDMDVNRGTICTWIYPNSLALGTSSVVFSITNLSTSISSKKNEFIIGMDADASPKELFASITIDDAIEWQINGPLISSLLSKWTNIVIIHNGTEPFMYIDGALYPFYYKVDIHRNPWITSIMASIVDPANSIFIGSTVRNYYPYYTFGFNGYIGETKMWNINMAASDILANYNNSIRIL